MRLYQRTMEHLARVRLSARIDLHERTTVLDDTDGAALLQERDGCDRIVAEMEEMRFIMDHMRTDMVDARADYPI